MSIVKVAATSRPTAVAGAIAGIIRDNQRAEVQAIGAGAVNQAIKAIAVAVDYLEPEGINICCVPRFTDIMLGDQERTAIRFNIEIHIMPVKIKLTEYQDAEAGGE